MKAYVITIQKNEKSSEAAKRCIASGLRHGLHIDEFPAFTPDDDPFQILEKKKRVIPNGLVEKWSRSENCAAAFLSHFSLWEKCKEEGPLIVFEHDAVLTNNIPNSILDGFGFKQCVSLGAPSYGNFKQPRFLGTGPLTSKKYFPGAHAYAVKPAAATTFIEHAQNVGARRTDVYLNIENFRFLEEFHPWPVEAQDYFTTIQNEEGCQAKHNYVKNKEKYNIIDAN